jgi:hypothetical protein
MIVFDENVHQQRIMASVAAWYRGRVLSITALRPGTLIMDEAIPAILRRVSQPTFVTTNVEDFWRRVPADPRYGIMCVVLPSGRLYELPPFLRRLFRVSTFKTKARRMGKVVRVSMNQLQYYDVHSRAVMSLHPWPDP